MRWVERVRVVEGVRAYLGWWRCCWGRVVQGADYEKGGDGSGTFFWTDPWVDGTP
ncbi:hypothetical protein A2U01_0096737, partial [Trifolium medium]|nr:hypothetical protein [Trifolium medium]